MAIDGCFATNRFHSPDKSRKPFVYPTPKLTFGHTMLRLECSSRENAFASLAGVVGLSESALTAD
jgi:hypothetical protein